MSNYCLIRFIRLVSRFTGKLCNAFLFRLDLSLHVGAGKKIRILNYATKQGHSKKCYTSITSIFRHMHDVLNVDKKINFHRLFVNCETNLMSLISS